MSDRGGVGGWGPDAAGGSFAESHCSEDAESSGAAGGDEAAGVARSDQSAAALTVTMVTSVVLVVDRSCRRPKQNESEEEVLRT